MANDQRIVGRGPGARVGPWAGATLAHNKGISSSPVGSWVKASQSWPPYGLRVPPWQDVTAHAAHTTAGHQ